jgi:CheY-like chemotaxis protein
MSTILIVDDEESIRDVAAAILEKQGHKTVRAADAEEAVAVIGKGGIDLALVDVVLPGRGGLDLLMQIRADYPALPVVVMSGKVRTDASPFRTLAHQFGAKFVLSKPFTSRELAESITMALGSRTSSK